MWQSELFPAPAIPQPPSLQPPTPIPPSPFPHQRPRHPASAEVALVQASLLPTAPACMTAESLLLWLPADRASLQRWRTAWRPSTLPCLMKSSISGTPRCSSPSASPLTPIIRPRTISSRSVTPGLDRGGGGSLGGGC